MPAARRVRPAAWAGVLLLAAAISAAPAGDATPPRPPRPLQVLVIEGGPRWEYRAHRTLLERAGGAKAPVFNPRFLFLAADDDAALDDERLLDRLPARGELDHFDLVVLGDADPSDRRLGDDHLANVARHVRAGGGLLVVAGPHHTPRALKGTALEAVLPVELAATPKDKPAEKPTTGYRPVPTAAGLAHPAFRLGADAAASARAWAELPELYWWADGYTARAGAEVLAVHPTAGAKDRPHPLVVRHAVGKGRCLFVGFDGTWRWRANEGWRHHETFWLGVWRSLAAG